MRFPDCRETGEARPHGSQSGPRARGGRKPAARPRPRSSEGQGTRVARVTTHRGGGRDNRPRYENGGERGVCGGGPRNFGGTRGAGADRGSAPENPPQTGE